MEKSNISKLGKPSQNTFSPLKKINKLSLMWLAKQRFQNLIVHISIFQVSINPTLIACKHHSFRDNFHRDTKIRKAEKGII